ncbi:MAG: mannose-6-phosphate isomerase [Ruminococcaceae bacterium]|nr:mannose-6-phosphate isomerase [Oscillospiraceae bacterium]
MKFEPLFFERNRVGRVYTGGKLFHGFFGDEPLDGFLPEEWIASSVKALNKEMSNPKEGVSKVKDMEMYFDELLCKYPLEMLGSSEKMRILVKTLDSAVRLPAQAHPDKSFSRKYFNSNYGKTESWLILDTRPDAKIYFGFKDGVDEEMFSAAIDASETDKDAMERLMESFEPKVGEVFLVPAKTVHAIGAGCLLLEVQEPTDFTIQPEHWCDEYKLSDKEMYIGLSKAEALECFDFGKAPTAKITPCVIKNDSDVKIENLITEKNTDCFVINRITLNNGEYKLSIEDSYGVYIVTEGSGEIFGEDYSKKLEKGDYFFVPACLMNKFTVSGKICFVECW